MHLNRTSYSSTIAVPVDLLGAPWVSEEGGELASHYYRARYYDPKAGRFISEDPIGFAGGANFYSYVRSHPTGSKDPSGLVDFKGDPNDVKRAYDLQAKLRNKLTAQVKDYFKQVFDADLDEYLSPGKRGHFDLKKTGGKEAGHCGPGYFDKDVPWINTSKDQFGGEGEYFMATLIHELVHLADRNDFWSGSYEHSAAATHAATEGLLKSQNPFGAFEGLSGYYGEYYQFGKVLTPGK